MGLGLNIIGDKWKQQQQQRYDEDQARNPPQGEKKQQRRDDMDEGDRTLKLLSASGEHRDATEVRNIIGR